MTNVIVPIVEDVGKFCEFIRRESSGNVKFFVGVRKSLAEPAFKNLKGLKAIELHVYADNARKEEIINSLHSCKMKKGKIMIVRRALTSEEWQKLTNSSSDIARISTKHNKFVSWLKNLGKMIVKKIFAFTFFDDISSICYGENLFELMSVCQNLSMASRVNKYVGVSIENVQTQEKQVKKEYNRFLNVLIFTLWTLFFVGSVAGAVCVGIFVSSRALSVVFLMFWVVVALMCWLVGLVNFVRTIAVGDLRYGKAQEIESEFSFIEQEEQPVKEQKKKTKTALGNKTKSAKNIESTTSKKKTTKVATNKKNQQTVKKQK